MKKNDKLPLILSIVGLVADSLAIYAFYRDIQNTNTNNEIGILSILLLYFIITYSWFTISWIISKNSFVKIDNEDVSNKKIITKTTFGIGFLLFPLSIIMTILSNNVAYVFIHLLIWIIVYVSVRLLISVLFPEFAKNMKNETVASMLFGVDLNYSGKWICEIPYASISSGERFKKGDFIMVFEREHLGDGIVTNNFSYNSSNNHKGKIDYTELETYWKISR